MTQYYVMGWNVPGYLPEMEPEIYETFEDARAALIETLLLFADTSHRKTHRADYGKLAGFVANWTVSELNETGGLADYAGVYAFWINETESE